MGWLSDYARSARLTDRFEERDTVEHIRLIAAGLGGEAGSILAEFKKEQREREAYPHYQHRLVEEFGDFLWYFVRFADLRAPGLTDHLELHDLKGTSASGDFIEFGARVGRAVGAALENDMDFAQIVADVWTSLCAIAEVAHVELQAAADANLRKNQSIWPELRKPLALFDADSIEEEQIPRQLTVEFRERKNSPRNVVYLRCNGINFGDRLTDNIEGEDDGYRFHDIFHFAYAVYLGWSPVVRALLKAKRKSEPAKDEGQDGARAIILEEAVSATVFSRGKHMKLFAGATHVDYDLLKTIREFVRDLEVAAVPLWQWDEAIIRGFAVFRELMANRGGTVRLDLIDRTIEYQVPSDR